MQAHQNLIRVRVWDLPTRLFHWALVLCLVGLVATGTAGGESMTLHLRLGHAMLGLLVFRLAWGLIGGHWSRFRSFCFSPRAVLADLRGQRPDSDGVGHSPLGALSVWAMLLVLAAQVGSGLLSDDEIAFSGPLAHLVSNAAVGLATSYHTSIGKWGVLALVLVHLAAIVVYTRRRQRLIGAMLHGDKHLVGAATSSRDDTRSRLSALAVLALSSALSVWVYRLAQGL